MQESSGEESIPELIDKRGRRSTTPISTKKGTTPHYIGIVREDSGHSRETFSFSPLKDHVRTLPDAAPEIHPEEVSEEQIIYIDDDADPSPLQLLKRQVDHLLMPPPSETTPMTQKTSRT